MSSSPPLPATRRRLTWYQIALTLAADLVVLFAFLFFALGSAALDSPASALPPAAPIVPPAPPPWPPTARLLAIEEDISTPVYEETSIGISLQDANGRSLLAFGDTQPFVLASVSKVYLLVAYLAQMEERGERLGEDDLDVLDPMIRYSDNTTASQVWERIGELDGLNAFLLSKDLQPLTLAEDDAWGTLEASPAEVTGVIRLLAQGALLNPESTQLAMRLMSRIYEEQAWGVSSGAPAENTTVYLKNGWYPEQDGWRVNSAGAVQTARGTYYLAVFAYPTPTMEEGVELIEGVASRINAAMR